MLMRTTALLVLLAAGCAQPKVAPETVKSSLLSSTQPVLREDTLKLLLDEEPDEVFPSEVTVGAIQSSDVPTSQSIATDGLQTKLFVDEEAGIAWITRSGELANHVSERFSPWRVDHLKIIPLQAKLRVSRPSEKRKPRKDVRTTSHHLNIGLTEGQPTRIPEVLPATVDTQQ